jgi:ADP-heptose:LPS heptosyltransferase
MNNQEMVLWKILFRFVDLVITLFPKRGAQFFDRAMIFFAKSSLGGKRMMRQDIQKLQQVKQFKKFCVLADVNIGDAIIAQSLVTSLRQVFPDAHTDYVVSRASKNLILGSSDASQVLPLYSQAPFPSEADVVAINNVMLQESYDVVFSFCPFLSSQKIKVPKTTAVISYLASGAVLMRAQENKEVVGHIIAVFDDYIKNLFRSVGFKRDYPKVTGGYITLSEQAYAQAQEFMNQYTTELSRKKILFNPDTSSKFSRIPFEMQVELLIKISLSFRTIYF